MWIARDCAAVEINARISPEDFHEDLCRFFEWFKGNDVGFLRVVPGGESELPTVSADVYHRLQFSPILFQQSIVLHRRRDTVPEQSSAVERGSKNGKEFVEFSH